MRLVSADNYSLSVSPAVTPRLVELMRAALASPPGLKLVAESNAIACRIRRQFYGARRRMRAKADFSFDTLSIVVQGTSVMLVVRGALATGDISGVSDIMPLNSNELPARINARCSKKASFLDTLQMLDVLARGCF